MVVEGVERRTMYFYNSSEKLHNCESSSVSGVYPANVRPTITAYPSHPFATISATLSMA